MAKKIFNLKLGLLNVRSLNTGRDELFVYMEQHKPDILALNETWIKAGDEKYAPRIPGYILKHKPRPHGVTGGGVGFYIRRNLKIRVRAQTASIMEQMWLELKLPGLGCLAIGTAYRPESVKVDTAIEELGEMIAAFGYCKHIFLLGDLNINLIHSGKKPASDLIAFFSNHNLKQIVQEPTRITNETATLLDLIITDSPNLCKDVKVLHNPVLSDHAMVIAELKIKKCREVTRFVYKRKIDKINLDLFKTDLKSLPWDLIYKGNTIDDKIEYLNTLINILFDKHAPLQRTRANNKYHPWITDNIKLMMKLRDNALKKARTTKCISHYEYYKSLRNFTTKAVDREKSAYFNFYVNKNKRKPNYMWNYLKRAAVLGDPGTSIIAPHFNDPDKINDFFLNLLNSTADVGTLNFNPSITGTDSEFTIETCTEDEIEKIIKSINTKAMGHDGITIDMIRMTLSSTCGIIKHIINESIQSSIYPEQWKLSKIKPIPKQPNVEELKDLRPISILPALSKVVEKIVCKQLTRYLESKNILPSLQSGFRSGYGTATALAKVNDDILTARDVGEGTILILLDFTKAFDNINIELLLKKLSYYGVSAKTCRWFRSFLCGRKQYVEIENAEGLIVRSQVKTNVSGTPQGSILSPLIFSVYTSDITTSIAHCKYHLYADDTQLYLSCRPKDVKQAEAKINQDLDSLSKWSMSNSLQINPCKSKYLVLGSRHQREAIVKQSPKIMISGKEIERVMCAKNLGLLMDGDLRYEEHVDSKIKNAFYRLKHLYQFRKYLAEDVRKTLTESIVLSLFNYCDIVYGPRITNYTKKKIQRVQNACTRYCYNIPRRSHITPYLNLREILNMTARRELHLACCVQKIIKSKKPLYLYSKLDWFQDAPGMNTRRRMDSLLKIPKHKSASYRGCFKFASTKIWNDLPPPLRGPVSVHLFKKKFIDKLLDRQKQL